MTVTTVCHQREFSIYSVAFSEKSSVEVAIPYLQYPQISTTLNYINNSKNIYTTLLWALMYSLRKIDSKIIGTLRITCMKENHQLAAEIFNYKFSLQVLTSVQ